MLPVGFEIVIPYVSDAKSEEESDESFLSSSSGSGSICWSEPFSEPDTESSEDHSSLERTPITSGAEDQQGDFLLNEDTEENMGLDLPKRIDHNLASTGKSILNSSVFLFTISRDVYCACGHTCIKTSNG